MKKTLLFITTLVLAVSLFAVTAFAAPLPTPWSDETMKIFVMEDFDNKSGDVPLAWTSGGMNDLEYKNGKLVFNECFELTGNWIYLKMELVSNAPSSTVGALGYGYYIENNTDAPLGLTGYWIGNDNWSGDSGMTYYTVVNGNVTEHTAGDYGLVELEVGFKGYLLFPFEGHTKGSWYQTDISDIAFSTTTDYVCAHVSPFAADQGNVIMDDFLLYGTSEMEGVTVEVTDTADVSVIAYAAMAITGLGALVVSKKRR